MKNKAFLAVWLLFLNAGPAFCQLTAQAIESAVARQKCAGIAAELHRTPLHSESMKFHGAVCLFRNGETERALALFREVRQLEGQRQHIAAFWEAKCLAALGQDSLALAGLFAIPPGQLSENMLRQPVFKRLAGNNPAFVRLRDSVRPQFNFWTTTLAAIAVLGLLIGVVLLLGHSRFSAGEKRLAVAVFAFALTLASYVLIWTGFAIRFPYLQNLWQFLTFLIGPSLFLYLKDTFQEDYTAKEAALHYLLPAVSGLLTLPVFLSNFGIQTGIPPDLFRIGSSPVLLTGHLLFYTVLIWNTTRNDWQVDANIKVWTNVVARGMLLYTLAFLSYFMLVGCSFFNPQWDYAISFVMALGILAVAYMGLVQRRVFRSEPIGNFFPVQKYRSSSLTDGASISIKNRLERLLAEEQVFRENELRLTDLAAYLDISHHQLSQVINEQYGVNFFELINRYRVEHVKRLLADPAYAQHTIIQIAYEAGFNNKVSFNRYFKKEIGLTPSAYRIRETSLR
ncbi:MAG: AraC family transcriptional regulator [Saprospiraceae bacterium]|nr:AraC family transcriptional regulator [Saprospiraceae bacterium]